MLLGPPKSGKSSFLKAISGRLARGIKQQGVITYNGDTPDCGKFRLSNVVSYVEQLDNNEPLMTVRETFQFAAMCIGSRPSKAVREPNLYPLPLPRTTRQMQNSMTVSIGMYGPSLPPQLL